MTSSRSHLSFGRVLIKVSGEALGADGARGGLGVDKLRALAAELAAVHERGTQIAVVVGGGNIVRGSELEQLGTERVTADHMGMLATVINGLALKDALRQSGVDARVLSAIPMGGLCDLYSPAKCIHFLEKARVAILAGGTGNPFFTTDSTAALRAAEIGAGAVLKATKVDGVYSDDPERDPSATRYDRLTYMQVIEKRLAVMDLTAVTLCMEQRLPIIVFSMRKSGAIARVIAGDDVGTLVEDQR